MREVMSKFLISNTYSLSFLDFVFCFKNKPEIISSSSLPANLIV